MPQTHLPGAGHVQQVPSPFFLSVFCWSLWSGGQFSHEHLSAGPGYRHVWPVSAVGSHFSKRVSHVNPSHPMLLNKWVIVIVQPYFIIHLIYWWRPGTGLVCFKHNTCCSQLHICHSDLNGWHSSSEVIDLRLNSFRVSIKEYILLLLIRLLPNCQVRCLFFFFLLTEFSF